MRFRALIIVAMTGMMLLSPSIVLAVVNVSGDESNVVTINYERLQRNLVPIITALWLIVAGYWAMVRHYRQRVAKAITPGENIWARVPALLFGLLYMSVLVYWLALIMGTWWL